MVLLMQDWVRMAHRKYYNNSVVCLGPIFYTSNIYATMIYLKTYPIIAFSSPLIPRISFYLFITDIIRVFHYLFQFFKNHFINCWIFSFIAFQLFESRTLKFNFHFTHLNIHQVQLMRRSEFPLLFQIPCLLQLNL